MEMTYTQIVPRLFRTKGCLFRKLYYLVQSKHLCNSNMNTRQAKMSAIQINSVFEKLETGFWGQFYVQLLDLLQSYRKPDMKN